MNTPKKINMITLIAKTEPVHGEGTLTSVKNNLPIMISNNAIEQLTDRFRERLSGLTCSDHPEHQDCTIEISVPGGNVLENNSFESRLFGFCCDQFRQHIAGLLVTRPDNSENPA